MIALWQQLAAAETFVEVATVICNEAPRRFSLVQCCVTLHGSDGRPHVAVDNLTDLSDDRRWAWVDSGACDPLYRSMLEHRAPVGDDHVMLLPLVDLGGVTGSIRCCRTAPLSDELRRDLGVMSAHVSVRLAQLGVSSHAIAQPLSPRQHAVADLAARGQSNLEIADALAISDNTVKKQLKEIYRRLDITNRTELAVVLRRPAVSDRDAPFGITRVGAITITRRQIPTSD